MKRTADIIPIVVERSTTTHEDRVEVKDFEIAKSSLKMKIVQNQTNLAAS